MNVNNLNHILHLTNDLLNIKVEFETQVHIGR
jgi:hypothetical protein